MNTLDIIGSLRYDNSNLYADNLSPKLAASWKPVSDLTLRASIGTGYKSPDFEQLYLNWTNTTEGYTVLGAKFVDDGLKQLAASGQISDSIIKNIHVNPLQPEKSIAFDIGGTYSSNDFYEIRINIFRNNITNLIDFLRLAVKSNGQNLDTYTNVSKMLSQGAEIKLRVNPLKYFAVDISYQYLETADDNVVDSIKSGKIITRDVNNVERKMTLADYGGLFNRSKHSGVIKFIYSNEELGLISSLRSIFRGKYGLADANGNLILDDPREYAPGYAIWNFTVSKQLIKYFIIQGGIDNIFNKKGPNTQFITPGTTVFVNLTFNYNLD